MTKKLKTKNSSVLKKFLKKNPKTIEMEILVADIHGVLRGKRIRSNEFESVFKDGFTMPGGTVLLDILGGAVPDISWSGDDGDPDTDAEVIAESLVRFHGQKNHQLRCYLILTMTKATCFLHNRDLCSVMS